MFERSEEEFKDYERCYYCKAVDHAVEAGGIWYCPNPLCPGPGGGHKRHILACTLCKWRDANDSVCLEEPCDEMKTIQKLTEQQNPGWLEKKQAAKVAREQR